MAVAATAATAARVACGGDLTATWGLQRIAPRLHPRGQEVGELCANCGHAAAPTPLMWIGGRPSVLCRWCARRPPPTSTILPADLRCRRRERAATLAAGGVAAASHATTIYGTLRGGVEGCMRAGTCDCRW